MERERFKDRYIFPASELPEGFRFPTRYLSLITSPGDLPNLTPWYFLAMDQQNADFWLNTMKEQYPTRKLIPIAMRGDLSDTLACFEGTDVSGNPPLHHIHAYTEPGWEQRGTWNDFDDWYRQAEEDAAEFKAADEK